MISVEKNLVKKYYFSMMYKFALGCEKNKNSFERFDNTLDTIKNRFF